MYQGDIENVWWTTVAFRWTCIFFFEMWNVLLKSKNEISNWHTHTKNVILFRISSWEGFRWCVCSYCWDFLSHRGLVTQTKQCLPWPASCYSNGTAKFERHMFRSTAAPKNQRLALLNTWSISANQRGPNASNMAAWLKLRCSLGCGTFLLS